MTAHSLSKYGSELISCLHKLLEIAWHAAGTK